MTALIAKWRFFLLKPEILVIIITLTGFGLRIWRLDSVPPGWRDDELINSLVISQKVLDGQWAVYYSDASGHEALYHILNAGMLALFGPGVAGIRLLSAILGTLTIPLSYLIANRFFGWKVGLVASAGLSVSFWSLMYSRIGIRHISLLVFLLPALYFFIKGLDIDNAGSVKGSVRERRGTVYLALVGCFVGIGFYTYFASRGIPAILLGVLVYVLLVNRSLLRRRWKALLLMIAVSLILVIPLLVTLARQPDSEARVQELAVPLQAARAGDLGPLGEHIARTFAMYHSDGDEEWLYNIPNRPLFSPVVAVVFWMGIALAILFAIHPLLRHLNLRASGKLSGWLAITPGLEVAGALLLTWWLLGLAPAFISVPPASLGHTIIAQPVSYIVLALPVFSIDHFIHRRAMRKVSHDVLRLLPAILGCILVLAVAWRDIPAYFQSWPERGMTRFLYRADLLDLANYLNQHPEFSDFGVTSLLAGPWDREAFRISLDDQSTHSARWFNADRVVLLRTSGAPAKSFTGYPVITELEELYYSPVQGVTVGGYQLSVLSADIDIQDQEACFQNNFCLLDSNYDTTTKALDLIFEVQGTPVLPEKALISNPPPPGVYAGSRLDVFSQLLDEDGQVITGDDGMWIDVYSLGNYDRFLQQHRFDIPAGTNPVSVIYGLYDPFTGKRIPTDDGRDYLQIFIKDVSTG